ncbi:MAG: glutamyl-tRNA reductase [Cyanobacteria bacterium SZAS LIN-3]|nr:glutamyl-tRNA reductase [Cyanobacteria bacterium SZAS LIN-3]
MNHLVVCGINYHSAPIAIRERFCIPDSCVGHALEGLKHFRHIKESAILSTCNRTEVYAVVDDVAAGLREIQAFFQSVQSVNDHAVLKPNFRLLRDDVVLHLMRVASGLDSMVLGEGQIMSQVKAAHQTALEKRTSGPVLDMIFKLALTCGKRVRSETTMGKRAVSVSSAAVELARETLGPLKDKNTTIIGMGKMGQICAKHLLSENGKPVIVLNRSAARIDAFLQNKLNNRERLTTGFDYSERAAIAAQSDLVIVASGSKNFVLTRDELAKQRHESSPAQVIIDISVPRAVDPTVAELPGVELFVADDLSKIVGRNLAEREALVCEAETIVFEMMESFHNWERSQLVVPTITGLREKIEAIRLEQIAKNSGTPGMESDFSSKGDMESISRAIVNQILHHPTVHLKATKDYEILRQQAEALRKLFNLDPIASAGNTTSTNPGGHSANSSTGDKHKNGRHGHLSKS